MKQVFLKGGSVLPKEVSIPKLGERDVLIATHYSFISSGTEGATIAASSKSLLKRFVGDIENYSKKVSQSIKENGIAGTVALINGKKNQVMELGYSCSGRVVEIGSKVIKFRTGDFVACAGSGVANHAEFVAASENLVVKLKDDTFLRDASVTAIGAIAMQGVRRAKVALGEKVCVIGLGLIGQITVQLLKASGCNVLGVDIKPERISLAETLGCDKAFNALSCDIKKEIDFHTEHYGVDTVIITAAASSGDLINTAMEITRRKGKVVLVGDVKLDFSREDFYKKEIDFLISCSYGPGRYDNSYEADSVDYPYAYVRWTENRNMKLFVELIEQKKILVSPVISEVFDISNVQDAYSKLKESLGLKSLGLESLGLVLSYKEQSYKPVSREQASKPVSNKILPYVPRESIRALILGAGGFAKVKLLPLLSGIKGLSINSIVDINSANASNIASQYGIEKVSNDYQDFLGEDVDMVVIATPHELHAKHAIDCIRAGKAVFIEKPAAINAIEFDELKTVANNKGVMFAIDFNRSFAPFMLDIKSELDKRVTPSVITYRMNAGYISKDHWVQKQGGRIIGEACHIFELFCFLTNAKPLRIVVSTIKHDRDDLCSSDNFSVLITFSDGSICTLIYTSLGNSGFNKEYMEVFYDGKSIVMDDYKILNGYGVSLNKKTKSPDKGHSKLLNDFVTSARMSSVSPISLDRIVRATEISFIVDRLAREGGGSKDLE